MKRTAEFIAFAAIAGVIHVALFSSAPDSGVKSSGAGGEALVSIQAAPPTIAEMVEAWERPPQPVTALDTETPPLPQAQAPALPQFELAQAPRAAALMALADPDRSEAPQADTAPPPPPPAPKPKPEPAPEPKPRPRPAPKPQPEAPQARKAAQTSAGRAEQKAAGAGGGAQAGQAGGAQAATADAGRQAKLQNVWGAKIRARVARRTPRGKGSGTVLVHLTVARSGQLLGSRIARSSGNAALDQAAMTAVRRAGRFPAAPKKLTLSQMSFTLPIRFSR